MIGSRCAGHPPDRVLSFGGRFIVDLRQLNVIAASTPQIIAVVSNQRLKPTQLGGNQTAASKKTPASPTNPQVVGDHTRSPLPKTFMPSCAAISPLASGLVKTTDDDLEAQYLETVH